LLAVFFLSAVAVDVALADGAYILATGRRDPRIYAIDFNAALRPQNNNTSHAVVSRSKVLPDRLDGTPLGDPANIVLSEDKRTAYVVNHLGAINNAEFLQHGGRGGISVMDVKMMIRPSLDNTDRALVHSLDSGYFGAVGLLLLPELLLVAHSENWLTEDGSNRISLVDRSTGGLRGQIEMALGRPPHACPDFPVPFVSPTPPPVVPLLALSRSSPANGRISPSRGTRSQSSMWISRGQARRTQKSPGSGSEPTIPMAKRGPSYPLGLPTGGK
jgi:hypothetical protein